MHHPIFKLAIVTLGTLLFSDVVWAQSAPLQPPAGPLDRLLYHALRCPSVVEKATGWVSSNSGTLDHFDSGSSHLVNHDELHQNRDCVFLFASSTRYSAITTESGDDRSHCFLRSSPWSPFGAACKRCTAAIRQERSLNRRLWTLRSVQFDRLCSIIRVRRIWPFL